MTKQKTLSAESIEKKFRVPTNGKFNIKNIAPDLKVGFEKQDALNLLAEEHEQLKALQNLLYADNSKSVLIVFQAMDTGGKDGTIRKVLGPLNPQGVRVHSFKKPNPKEMGHDFLWRIHTCTPKHGMIHVFNRSHYEDVLIARVHNLAPAKIIEDRYRHINNFEDLLADSGTLILKFFLNISKEEQNKRLQERLDIPEKNWKFSSADMKERNYWDDYMKTYEKALQKCSTKQAPWYVIPANRKWQRNLIIAKILRHKLQKLNCKYPQPEKGLKDIIID